MRPNEGLKNWLTKTAQRYHEDLDEETASYLAARGLDQDAVHGSLLGLVANPEPIHDPFQGRLSIPYITPTGVVTMRFRCLHSHHDDPDYDGKCPKYTQPEASKTHLYNVQALHDADVMIGISEGELDAVVGSLAGIPTAGVPGANNWKPLYFRLFEDFERVLIFGDGDKAGREFTAKLLRHIPGGESRVLPKGHDLTSFVQEFGADSFIEFAVG